MWRICFEFSLCFEVLYRFALQVHAQDWPSSPVMGSKEVLEELECVVVSRDPTGEGTREDEQAEDDGLGGGRNQISGSGLRRFRGRRSPHGRAHIIARLETVW